MPKTADLLEEIAALKAMLIAADAREKRKDERIARLEKLVAAFKQAVFGRKSEKSDPDQFELALEDLETAMAVIHAEEDTEDRAAIDGPPLDTPQALTLRREPKANVERYDALRSQIAGGRHAS